MSEAQTRILFVSLGAVVAFFGLGYIKHSNDIDNSRTQCLAKNSPQRCECYISIMKNEVSFLAETPLVGRFFEPSATRMRIATERAQRMC